MLKVKLSTHTRSAQQVKILITAQMINGPWPHREWIKVSLSKEDLLVLISEMRQLQPIQRQVQLSRGPSLAFPIKPQRPRVAALA